MKTRLTPSLPLQAVAAFYRCLLEDTLALARSLGRVEVAIMCPDSDVNELASLAGQGARVVAQKGEGLAAGLTSVFFWRTRSKRSRYVTWSSGRHTMEATTSLGQRLFILRFSHATEWAPVAHWRGSYRALELLSYP